MSVVVRRYIDILIIIITFPYTRKNFNFLYQEYYTIGMMQDFPHVPAPILMQGLMKCPEHISWYSIGLNFLKTFL